MSDFELATPDDTWPESAISAYRMLASLVLDQSESLRQQGEMLLKQEATIQALQERLNLNSSKSPSGDRTIYAQIKTRAQN